MKNTNYLIALPTESRCAFIDFTGHSGHRYRFLYSEQHRAMIFQGRELTGEEFDAVARDIFLATPDQNFARPMPVRVVPKLEEQTPSEPATPPADPPKEPEQPPAPPLTKRITPAEPIET
jgi:hypothetical protein